jgi:hypothetical protein
MRRGLSTRLRSGLADHGGVARYLLNGAVVRVAPIAVRYRATWLVRALLGFVLRFGSAETYRLVSRAVIALTRHRAFGNLPAGPLPMALRLLVTDDPWHDPSRPDLGWGDRCWEVHRISVGGAHKTMLALPTREVIMGEPGRLEVALRLNRSAGQQECNDE